jgi:hypothetical protein
MDKYLILLGRGHKARNYEPDAYNVCGQFAGMCMAESYNVIPYYVE